MDAIEASPAPSLDLRGITPPDGRCRAVVLMNRDTRRFLGLPCGSWRCPTCAVRRRRQVMRRLAMGIDRAANPRFLTLTSPAADSHEASLRLLTKRFEKLRRIVRRRGWRGEFEYGGVVEFTKRGIAHFHVLLRGPWLLQATWSSLAVEAGFGEVVWIERASKGKLAGYVTKSLTGVNEPGLPGYLSKALAAPAAFPRHFRRVRFSRGWSPDWVTRRRRDPAKDGPSPWERVPGGSPLMRTYGLLMAESSRLAASAETSSAGGGSP